MPWCVCEVSGPGVGATALTITSCAFAWLPVLVPPPHVERLGGWHCSEAAAAVVSRLRAPWLPTRRLRFCPLLRAPGAVAVRRVRLQAPAAWRGVAHLGRAEVVQGVWG